jgi:anti-sigma factor RsiW
MMHATADDFELFVSAQLNDERSHWLERHCDTCDSCASALAHEAQLEVSLRTMTADRRCGMRADVLTVPAVPERETPRPRYFYAVTAAACAVLAFAAARLPQVALAKPAPVVVADAGGVAILKSDVERLECDVDSLEPVMPQGMPSGGSL